MIYQNEKCSAMTYRNSELHICPHLSLSSVIRHLWSLQFYAAMVQDLFWNSSHHTFVELHLKSLKVLIYLKQKINEALCTSKFRLECMWVKPHYYMPSYSLLEWKLFFFFLLSKLNKKAKLRPHSLFFFFPENKVLESNLDFLLQSCKFSYYFILELISW